MVKLMARLTITLFIIINCYIISDGLVPRGHEKVILDVPRLIQSKGYPAERHRVLTDDGYILELHRIPHGKSEADARRNTKRPVVVMVHCIMCTSSIWVMQGPQNGLGYMLADDGYDVWMINVRGNSYSSNHLKYLPNEEAFWKFSWHEHGYYDVPTSIDYVLDITNQTKVNYIGFSMGTTIYFVTASTRPEYNDKIIKSIALAPAVYVEGAKGFVPRLSLSANFLEMIFKNNNVWMLPPPQWNIRKLLRSICDYSNPFSRPLCSMLLNVLGKIPMKNLDLKKLNYFFRFFPDYTSIYSALHYSQLKNTGVFCQYDSGLKRNMNVYGSPSPPVYNLTQINTPVHLFYSMGDKITNAEGSSRLASDLPNAYSHVIDSPTFSHAHFSWGNDVGKTLYKKIMKILKE